MADFESAGLIEPYFRKKPKKNHTEWTLVEAPTLSVYGKIADTHAHLNILNDPALSIAQAAFHGVSFIEAMTDPLGEGGTCFYDDLAGILTRSSEILKNFTSMPDMKIKNCELPKIRLACGVHPHEAKGYCAEIEEELISRLKNPLTSALGEVGLDYHYDFSPRDVQINAFERQIEIAQKTELPIILHIREAFDDAYACLKNAGFVMPGMLLHCYTSDAKEIKRWVDAGCYVAFGGAFTFKKLDEVREAIRYVPKDRLLTETDSPYMAPEPFRGSECGPAHTIFTTKAIIDYLKIDDVAGFLSQLESNAIALLDRAPTAWQEDF